MYSYEYQYWAWNLCDLGGLLVGGWSVIGALILGWSVNIPTNNIGDLKILKY